MRTAKRTMQKKQRQRCPVCRRPMTLADRSNCGYTITELAQCFGEPSRTVLAWVQNGWFGTPRRDGSRVPESGVLRFFRTHGSHCNLARVDQEWLRRIVALGLGVSK